MKTVMVLASIIKKKKKGQVYYYLVESARVDGKPRIVHQKYLGRAEHIADVMEAPSELDSPKYSVVLDILADIKQVITVYPKKRASKKDRQSFSLSKLDPDTKRIMEALNLGQYRLGR